MTAGIRNESFGPHVPATTSNLQGMSTESFDDVDIVDYISPSDMAFLATGNPASSISPSNGSPHGSPTVPSMLSDNDYSSVLLTLNSFIPIMNQLPGFCLDQNVYYIRGPIATDDWERLCNYTRMVSKFIVTDDANKVPEERISPSAFLRLARLQHPHVPLLPSLSDLIIINADESIAYLELLLTASLESLEASYISDAQQSTFFTFLTALEQEAPLLQTLILGPGRFISSSLQIISQFNNLRHLELKNEDPEIPFEFFENIGSLPKLETLILDARYVSNIVTKNSMEEPTIPLPPLEDVMDGKNNKNGVGDVLLSQTCPTPIPTSSAFNQLTKLHVIGWLPLLQDLIPRITSTRLEDISIALIRLSNDELQVSLAKEKAEKAEQEKIAEEKRKRDEEEKRKRDEEEETEKAAIEKHIVSCSFDPDFYEPPWTPEEPIHCSSKKKKKKGMSKAASVTSAPTPAGTTCASPFSFSSSKQEQEQLWIPVPTVPAWPWMPVPVLQEPQAMPVPWEPQELQEERERSLKEQERLASVSYTVPFTELLRTLCCRWTASLKTVSVCQLLGGSFQRLLDPPTLPEEMFWGLLFLPAIESLEVKGWMLDSVESVLSVAESIPNLKSLLLPLDESNSGISLSTLRHVAITCPKLKYFQCRIDPLSLIPKYTVPTTFALSHGLRTLSVGNSSPLPDAKQLYLIARHLYLLFPNLETINTSEEYNAEQWIIVDELVKMCQTARTDDMNCRSVPIPK